MKKPKFNDPALQKAYEQAAPLVEAYGRRVRAAERDRTYGKPKHLLVCLTHVGGRCTCPRGEA